METLTEPNVAAPEVLSNPHAYVVVRHSATCKDREKGSDWQKCRCRKSIFTYFPATGKTKKKSSKTRVWAEAQDIATAFNEQFDPDKVRIKRLEAERQAHEGTTVRIEEAIGRFLGSKIIDSIAEETLKTFQSVLGYVDPQTFVVRRPGRLLAWLDKQNPRPVFVSDLTSAAMEEFRGTWKTPKGVPLSQTSSKDLFTRLKQFFAYCEGKKWVPETPLHDHKYPKVDRGNRTGAFSDEQWVLIELTAQNNCTATRNFDGSDRTTGAEYDEARRLLAFVELLRWSGMAIIDAVQFRHDLIDANGAMLYKRQKTKKVARPGVLPKHVLEYLRTIPVGDGTAEQPFLRPGIRIQSNTAIWRGRLAELYKAAGIKKIKTDVGTWKTPKAHVLRDTFAVGLICEGIGSDKVAAALGDTIKMVEEHYSPWIQKMKDAQNEATKAANTAQVERLQAMKAKVLAGVGGHHASG